MLVGLAQVGALIPGVSRSGSTLTAAMFLDLRTRRSRALSPFFLACRPFSSPARGNVRTLQGASLCRRLDYSLAVGLFVASISAFVAIWGLMRILEKFSSWPFVVYRFLLGVSCWAASRGLAAIEKGGLSRPSFVN